MTREEFFYKYGCECKDPNCSSVVKEKCSAEFFRDLDSVIAGEKKDKNLSDCAREMLNKSAEDDFIDRLRAHATYMNKEQLGQLVENWIRMHGPLTLKNGEIARQLLESEKEDEYYTNARAYS